MKFAKSIEKEVYDEFLNIDRKSYQQQIRYFEKNKSEIHKLPPEYRIVIDVRYVFALYEVQDYYGFLTRVDKLINYVVSENIYQIDGEDIFQELLYRKGKAAYGVLDYYKADHILSELVKIDNASKRFDNAYLSNAIDKNRYEGKILSAISMILFFLSAGIIAVELLVIRAFYLDWVSIFEWTRNTLFLLGIALILFSEFQFRYKAHKALKILKNK